VQRTGTEWAIIPQLPRHVIGRKRIAVTEHEAQHLGNVARSPWRVERKGNDSTKRNRQLIVVATPTLEHVSNLLHDTKKFSWGRHTFGPPAQRCQHAATCKLRLIVAHRLSMAAKCVARRTRSNLDRRRVLLAATPALPAWSAATATGAAAATSWPTRF
jgi:hypothetical protein